MTVDTVAAAVRPFGMIVRGAFRPAAEDGAPAAAKTLVMIGNAGPDMWRAFAAGRRDEPDPLDAWTRRVLEPVAASLGARALFPFDGPPHFPFQRWAMRADDVHPSPIGPLVHPVYGLWHAYRAAFALEAVLPVDAAARTASPCESCTGRPCLTTCPVSAFSGAGYDVPACRAHIGSADGADCMAEGCRARRACPLGREFHYEPAQAEFHMRHFLASARRRGGD